MSPRKYRKIIKLQEQALDRLEKNGRRNSLTARSLRAHLSLRKKEVALRSETDQRVSRC